MSKFNVKIITKIPVTTNTSKGRLRLDFSEWRDRRRLDDTAGVEPVSLPTSCLSLRWDTLTEDADSDLPGDSFTHTTHNNMTSLTISHNNNAGLTEDTKHNHTAAIFKVSMNYSNVSQGPL